MKVERRVDAAFALFSSVACVVELSTEALFGVVKGPVLETVGNSTVVDSILRSPSALYSSSLPARLFNSSPLTTTRTV